MNPQYNLKRASNPHNYHVWNLHYRILTPYANIGTT